MYPLMKEINKQYQINILGASEYVIDKDKKIEPIGIIPSIFFTLFFSFTFLNLLSPS